MNLLVLVVIPAVLVAVSVGSLLLGAFPVAGFVFGFVVYIFHYINTKDKKFSFPLLLLSMAIIEVGWLNALELSGQSVTFSNIFGALGDYLNEFVPSGYRYIVSGLLGALSVVLVQIILKRFVDIKSRFLYLWILVVLSFGASSAVLFSNGLIDYYIWQSCVLVSSELFPYFKFKAYYSFLTISSIRERFKRCRKPSLSPVVVVIGIVASVYIYQSMELEKIEEARRIAEITEKQSEEKREQTERREIERIEEERKNAEVIARLAKTREIESDKRRILDNVASIERNISTLDIRLFSQNSDISDYKARVEAFMMNHKLAVASIAATAGGGAVALDPNNEFSDDAQAVGAIAGLVGAFYAVSNSEEIIFVADQLNQADSHMKNLKQNANETEASIGRMRNELRVLKKRLNEANANLAELK